MKSAAMKSLGADHRAASRELTPFACQEIDAKLFAIINSEAEKFGLSGHDRSMFKLREYNRMRGAFNRGWCQKNAEMSA